MGDNLFIMCETPELAVEVAAALNASPRTMSEDGPTPATGDVFTLADGARFLVETAEPTAEKGDTHTVVVKFDKYARR